jgi:hypothetical protein
VTRVKWTLRVGFEPTREDPIWFQVKRLNHSAIAAAHWAELCCNAGFFRCQPFAGGRLCKTRIYYRFTVTSKACRDPGLNQGPSDLQSDALPTELSRLERLWRVICGQTLYVKKWSSIILQTSILHCAVARKLCFVGRTELVLVGHVLSVDWLT